MPISILCVLGRYQDVIHRSCQLVRCLFYWVWKGGWRNGVGISVDYELVVVDLVCTLSLLGPIFTHFFQLALPELFQWQVTEGILGPVVSIELQKRLLGHLKDLQHTSRSHPAHPILQQRSQLFNLLQ